MKKLITLLLTAFIITSVQVQASDIEVLPTMMSRSNEQDRVWVGSFQLVWNDFMDKVVFNPIRFREGTPQIVRDLNRQTFTSSDLSDKSYYKTTAKVTKNLKKQIAKAIRKKFKEHSDIIDKMDLTPRNDKYFIYAMLKKDFEFTKEFDKLGESYFGDGQIAEYFGIAPESDEALNSGVRVLFYNSPEDFAVALMTKDNEEVYIYKNASNKAFNLLYSDMWKKAKAFSGKIELKENDELKVPNIKFFVEKEFEELANRRVMGTNLVIAQAVETVKFGMNNKGVELKSEAGMSFVTTSLLPSEEEPRFFYCDDTFVVFIKEKTKRKPYFALRVNDISKFQNGKN